MNKQSYNAFSIDLEDWFHLLDTNVTPTISEWGMMESRVERNTEILLNLLDKYNTKCTFFVLGWIAENFPNLIKYIHTRGHEIASHGYAHKLVYQQSPEEFRDDIKRSKDVIGNTLGQQPIGYRAPGFSIKKESIWALDILVEEGFEYDSSIFPAERAHGGYSDADPLPKRLENGLIEFPISTIKIFNKRLAFLGGGYLRLLPKRSILFCAENKVRKGEPLILYLHPRDIDINQPRLNLGRIRAFRSYVGLKTTLDKTRILLEKYPWITFGEYKDRF